jgi:TonB family protein
LPKPRLLHPIILLLACLTATIDVRAQDTTRTYFEFQVTKPVRQAPGSKAPRYPVELRAAGVQGEVLAQFVVDTLGQPDVKTFKVLRSSHGLLTDAVQTALPDMRFTPAEVNGRKVRQLVQQPFVFAMASKDSLATLAAKSSVAEPPSVPAPRMNLPLTPAPHTGTVAGWTLTQTITMDSGGGAPVVVTSRMYGSNGRLRVEITNTAATAAGNMVLLADSATNRRSGVMASGRIVTVGPLGGQSRATLRTEPFVLSRKITDLGYGGRLAGVATRHYLLEDVSGTRLTLGDRTCVIERSSKTDVWNTTDASMADVRQRSSAAARLLQGSLAQIEVIADTAHRDRPPGATLKSIGQRTARDRNGALRTTVITTEVTGYTKGPLDAALFDPPEGYQIFDASAMQNAARVDSLLRSSAERALARMIDSTTAVPGEKRTCTTTKTP